MRKLCKSRVKRFIRHFHAELQHFAPLAAFAAAYGVFARRFGVGGGTR